MKKPQTKKASKKIMLYLPLGLQAEVRKVVEKHNLSSLSAGFRAVLRFGLATMKDADRMERPDLYMGYIAKEKKDD